MLSGVAHADPALDYGRRGVYDQAAASGVLTSRFGCEVEYTRHEPDRPGTDVWLILAHGFMRSQARMVDLAEHLASWGVPVATVDFCNSRWWAGHHDRNAVDLRAVANTLAGSGIVYVGFSAGGLSALLAAADDPRTVAYLGLDAVDSSEQGLEAAARAPVALYGLSAPPSACNARNNALEFYRRAGRYLVIQVVGSTHCHFELPYDTKCRWVCGRDEDTRSRAEIQDSIRAFVTAFALWQTAVDARGADWWTSGGTALARALASGEIRLVAEGGIASGGGRRDGAAP